MAAVMGDVFDARTMNHMDPESKAIHVRLEHWGAWARENKRAWPSITLLGRVMEQGLNGAGQSGSPPISMPEAIASTDRAVAKLCDIDRRIVTSYYTREEPLEALGRRMNKSKRHLQNVLRRARWRIALQLEGVGRNKFE